MLAGTACEKVMNTLVRYRFCLVVLAASTALTNTLLSQTYYPLKVGNRWDYLHSISNNPARYPYSIKVIGDSTFSNGKTYFVFDREDLSRGRFVRTDSLGVYYYNTRDSSEALLYKFNAAVNDSWPARFDVIDRIKLVSTGTQRLFGEEAPVRTYLSDGLVGSTITLAEGYGPIYYSSSLESPDGSYVEMQLQGGIISDTLFGQLLVSVNPRPTLPAHFRMLQNYPNPFNPSTTISYAVPRTANVSLRIFNMLSQQVALLVNERREAGNYQSTWNANVPSDIYFYRLQAGEYVETKKMVLIRR